MKRLTCEMCGGADLIKNDGVFVCQSCGTKYSVEEAKKMMHDGVVEMSGTLRLDNSIDLEKTLKNARRARDVEDYELAEKYYGMVFDADSDNWEGVFFYTYFRAVKRVNKATVTSINNCLNTVLNLIKQEVTDPTEQTNAAAEVTKRSIHIYLMFYKSVKKDFDQIIPDQVNSDHHNKYVDGAFVAINALYYLGDKLDEILGDNGYANVLSVISWKEGVKCHSNFRYKLDRKRLIEDKIARYDPKYVPSHRSSSWDLDKCYIATSVYGSYDCPEVWTLRRFRDFVLAESWYGRAFIRIYYATSPTAVKLFGGTKWFNYIWRGVLGRVIKALHRKGYEDAPYLDKN